MRLQRKLTVAVLGLVVPPTVAVGLILLLLSRRGLLEEPPALLAAVVVGSSAMMACLVLVARGLAASLVRTVEELRRGAELMATVAPGRRLQIRTGDELEALADEINRLADQLRVARDSLDEHVVRGTHVLRVERAHLTAIVDGLADGVVAVGAERRITLANPAARRLLNDGGALVGETLFDFVSRDALAPHLGRPEAASRSGVRLVVETAAGVTLDGVLNRLPDAGEGAGAFVLLLRGPTRGAPADTERAGWSTRERLEPAPLRLAGMGLRSGTGAHLPGPVRSELYDFSLLDEVARRVGPAERDHRLDRLTFVVFDTETTGLRPDAGDRVISLAGVRVVGTEVRRHEVFDALVHPGRPVAPESVRFHGITDGDLAVAPPPDVVLPAFLGFVGEAVLVGHEVSFDLGFLVPEALRLGLPPLTGRPLLDTRLLSRCLHGPAANHSLEEIALRLGVPVVARHSALGDALTTAEVFVRLLVILEKRGVRTLGDVLEAARRARTPTI